MKRWMSILLLMSVTLAVAQKEEEPEGYLSYIDIDAAPVSNITGCMEESADTLRRDCLPHVEVVVIDAFEDCVERGEGCERAGAYPVSFLPEELAEKTEEAFDEAWDTYYDDTIDEVSKKVNELPFCWLPSVCPTPNIRWDCVAERLADSATVSLTELQPKYWADVGQALATHMPTALWWESPLPDGGAVISPIFSLTPKPQQYLDLVEEPRDVPYYSNLDVPIPYLPNEVDDNLPGITDKELRKADLEVATILEYQEFGFVTFFEAYGDFENTLFFKPVRGAYMFTLCLTPKPPFVFIIPVPTPLFIPLVPKAFTDQVSVAEGYTLPRVKGNPLW